MKAQLTHARGDRTGANERYAATGLSERLDLVCQAGDSIGVQRAVGVRQHAGANFDHDKVGRGCNFLPEKVGHGRDGTSRPQNGHAKKRLWGRVKLIMLKLAWIPVTSASR